jgi:large subunit ribosomal protein L15
MELSNLQPAKGKGGTSTRGHKGAKSRSGYSKKVGFEGGQMPLQRRLPKYGFTNINRKEYKGINISTLQTLAEKKSISSIDIQIMIDAGLASKNEKIKILGKGELKTKLTVKAHAFSKSAIEAIKGTAEKI